MLKMLKGPQPAAVAARQPPAATPPRRAGSDPRRAGHRRHRPRRRRRRCSPTPTAPGARSGQLLSFDSFATKDPFAQQVDRGRPSEDPAPANDSARADAAGTEPRRPGRRPGTLDPLGSNPQDQDPTRSAG